jgi:hypothetical protein
MRAHFSQLSYAACFTLVLDNKELNDLHSPTNIVLVIKSRRMRWVGHVLHVGRVEAYVGFWCANLRERDHLGNPGIDERIILGWIFRKRDVRVWTRSSWIRKGTGGGRL